MTKDEYQKLADISESFSDFSRKIGYTFTNGTVQRKVKSIVDKYNLDVSHFNRNAHTKRNIVYCRVEKTCPVCGKTFETLQDHPREKMTCSHGCANTYFRTGDGNGNRSEKSYRTTCFIRHEKKCVVCGENVIVSVHHYDGNRNNNDVGNLVPLCPTHHQYIHSKHKHVIIDVVDDYVRNFVGVAQSD